VTYLKSGEEVRTAHTTAQFLATNLRSMCGKFCTKIGGHPTTSYEEDLSGLLFVITDSGSSS
jgi:hypothetical protein